MTMLLVYWLTRILWWLEDMREGWVPFIPLGPEGGGP